MENPPKPLAISTIELFPLDFLLPMNSWVGKLKINNFKDQLSTFTCHEEKQHQQSRLEASDTQR